jgi:hypothetical protein
MQLQYSRFEHLRQEVWISQGIFGTHPQCMNYKEKQLVGYRQSKIYLHNNVTNIITTRNLLHSNGFTDGICLSVI